ncbi:hypothetical protein FB107DRAFT_253845 [Schizophyllum commune]
MNIGDLLQETPSDDKARRQNQNRERDRETRDAQPLPHVPDRQPPPDQQRDSWNKYDRYSGDRRDKWPPIMPGDAYGGYRGMRETAGPGWPPYQPLPTDALPGGRPRSGMLSGSSAGHPPSMGYPSEYHMHPPHAAASSPSSAGPAPMYPPSILGPGAVQSQRPMSIGLGGSSSSSGPMLSGYAEPSPFHGTSAQSITGPGQPPGPPPTVSGQSSQAPRRSQPLQGPAQPHRSPAMSTSLRQDLPGWGPGRPPMSTAEMIERDQQERDREQRDRSRLAQMEWERERVERERDRERRKAMKPDDPVYMMPKHPTSRRDSTSNINPNLNSGAPSSNKRPPAPPKREHSKKEREVISVEDDEAQREADELRARNVPLQQLRQTREQVQGELLVLQPHAPNAPPPGMIGYGHDMRDRMPGHPNLPPLHHPSQTMYPTPPAPPPGQYAQMNRDPMNRDPLRTFQNQFHTGWVQEEPVSLTGSPQPIAREREMRDRDRDRERRKSKPGKARGEVHERDRDRERRERRSELMNMMYEPPVYVDRPREMYPEKIALDVVEWDREKEVRAKATVHLGTHVYPRIPFPYFFDIAPGGDEREKRAEAAPTDPAAAAAADFVEVDTETRATVLIPAAHLPTERPKRIRVWGGGLVPPPGYEESRRRRNKDSDTRGRRRIYTDDSDLFSCAVHAGWATWGMARQARREGWDMRVELRVLRCAASGACGNGKEELVGRFVGGPGERFFGTRPTEWAEEDSDDDEDEVMTSAGWGTGHDGSAIELLKVEFVKGVAHALGQKNRTQRILEYNERRLDLSSSPPSHKSIRCRKPKRAWPGPLPNAIPKIHLPPLEASLQGECPRAPTVFDLEADRRAMEMRTVKLSFGKENKAFCAGYKYDPDELRDALFPPGDEPPAKRRRLNEDDGLEPLDVNMAHLPVSLSNGDESSEESRQPIILETPKERYLLTPAKQGTYDLALVVDGSSQSKTCDMDAKESATNGVDGPQPAPKEDSTSAPKTDTLLEPGELSESSPVGEPSTNGDPKPAISDPKPEPKPEGDGVESHPSESRPKRSNKRKVASARKEPPKYAVPPANRVEEEVDMDAFEFGSSGLTCRGKRIPLVSWKFVPVEAS